ncbi:hypothetical protein RDV64_05890 [Acuticoccus sp. MNP-M23]|uniref:hypothetical protein n=1 Tax=Acuticoccus sp. MNP-M23 TaxID=3072793 RepID=UPI0028168973|nr:hypothetical protein [Acuticoccus sp. MNP-M23]WMS43922.1 hypothetical protein RDV64_05890 [Acuticoccus sp. MNP-M23]
MVDVRYADLTGSDLERIPSDVAAKLGLPSADTVHGGTRVGLAVFKGSGRESSVLARVITRLADLVPTTLRERDETRLDRLVDFYAEGEPRTGLDEDVLAQNARLRTAFLEEVPTFTAADIRKIAGSRSRNPSEPASRWKREGKVLAVPLHGADRYPAFQFDADGQPRRLIAEVLALLPQEMTPWQRAFWFASANGWLDGAYPANMLDNPHRVLAAARALGAPAAG